MADNQMMTGKYPILSSEACNDPGFFGTDHMLVMPICTLLYVELEAGKRFEFDLFAVDTDLGILESHTHLITADSISRNITRLMPGVESYMLYELSVAYDEHRSGEDSELKYVYCRVKEENSQLVMKFSFMRMADNRIGFTKSIIVPKNLYL